MVQSQNKEGSIPEKEKNVNAQENGKATTSNEGNSEAQDKAKVVQPPPAWD